MAHIGRRDRGLSEQRSGSRQTPPLSHSFTSLWKGEVSPVPSTSSPKNTRPNSQLPTRFNHLIRPSHCRAEYRSVPLRLWPPGHASDARDTQVTLNKCLSKNQLSYCHEKCEVWMFLGAFCSPNLFYRNCNPALLRNGDLEKQPQRLCFSSVTTELKRSSFHKHSFKERV